MRNVAVCVPLVLLIAQAWAGSAWSQELVDLDLTQDVRLAHWRYMTLGRSSPTFVAHQLGLRAGALSQTPLGTSAMLEVQGALAYGAAFGLRDEFFLDADLRAPIVRLGEAPDDEQALPLTEGRLRGRARWGLFDLRKGWFGIDLVADAQAQASGTMLRGRRRPEVGPAPYWETRAGLEAQLRFRPYRDRNGTPMDIVPFVGLRHDHINYLDASPIEGLGTTTVSFGLRTEMASHPISPWLLEWAHVKLASTTGTLRSGGWSSPVWDAPEGAVMLDPHISTTAVNFMHFHFEVSRLGVAPIPFVDGQRDAIATWLNSDKAWLLSFHVGPSIVFLSNPSRGLDDGTVGLEAGAAFMVPYSWQIALSTHVNAPSYTPDGQTPLVRWQSELDARWSPDTSWWGLATTLRFDAIAASPLDGDPDRPLLEEQRESAMIASQSEIHVKFWGLELGLYHLVRTFPGALRALPPGRQGLSFQETGLHLRLRSGPACGAGRPGC